MKKTYFLAVGLMMNGVSVLYAAGVQTDAGSLQQQIKPSNLPAIPSHNPNDLPTFRSDEIKSSTSFFVKSIHIEGNQEVDELVLHQFVKDLIGKKVSLADLKAGCQRITDYYYRQGYPLSRAVLPSQEVEDGRVTIQIVEAKYGALDINNKSKIRNSLIDATMSSFEQGEVIKQDVLEKTLLLLSDIPGGRPNVTFKAGQKVSESDMLLEVTPTEMLSGKAILDNWGNTYIDRTRLLANLNLINPNGYGDVLSVNYLTTGSPLQYFRLSYDSLINGLGSRIGIAYTDLDYRLGSKIKALGANGSATSYDLYFKQPLLRGRHNSLFLNLEYQHNVIKDRIDISNTKTDRDVNGALFSINGDLRDDFLKGGVNTYNVAYTVGNVNFNNANAKLFDASTRDTAGRYSKWMFNFNRLQNINDRTQLWFSFIQQIAQDNLDSSQKMTFGGPNSVRAYDNGTVSGDNGKLMKLELRRFLGDFYGAWQGVAFLDTARVEVNHDRWPADTGKNKASLCGIGLGLQWAGPQQTAARTFLATSIGGDNVLTENGNSTIGWFEIAKYF